MTFITRYSASSIAFSAFKPKTEQKRLRRAERRAQKKEARLLDKMRYYSSDRLIGRSIAPYELIKSIPAQEMALLGPQYRKQHIGRWQAFIRVLIQGFKVEDSTLPESIRQRQLAKLNRSAKLMAPVIAKEASVLSRHENAKPDTKTICQFAIQTLANLHEQLATGSDNDKRWIERAFKRTPVLSAMAKAEPDELDGMFFNLSEWFQSKPKAHEYNPVADYFSKDRHGEQLFTRHFHSNC